MTFKAPVTEEEWAEYLSALIDGELTNDEIAGIEILLKNNQERSAQLEDMKSTSGFLKKWDIKAPLPDASFIRDLRNQAKPNTGFALLRWLKNMKLRTILPSFSVGLLAGIFFMSAFNSDNTSQNYVAAASRYAEPEYKLSQRQTQKLFSEMDAEMLKVKILDELNKQNIEAALKAYKNLKNKHPESQALKKLKENRKLSFIL